MSPAQTSFQVNVVFNASRLCRHASNSIHRFECRRCVTGYVIRVQGSTVANRLTVVQPDIQTQAVKAAADFKGQFTAHEPN